MLLLRRGRFGDFDGLAEAIAGWDLNWRQLEGGALESELAQVGSGAALLTHVSFSRRFFQSGGTPPGARAFGIMPQGAEPITAAGREMNCHSVFAFPTDYEAVSGAGFRAHTMAYPEEVLRQAARELEVEETLERIMEQAEPTACDPRALRALRARLDQVVLGSDPNATPGQMAALRHEIEVELPMLLVHALTSPEVASRAPRPLAKGRHRVARRARVFIEEHAHEPPSIELVCRYAGVSRRALEYAFREHLGVSPKRYLQLVRFHAVRRELRSAGPEAHVADVAGRWGFWHMGQFAADYRLLFAELPSETLRCSVAETAGDFHESLDLREA